MAIQTNIERYIPKDAVKLPQYQVGITTIGVGGSIFQHIETLDFPLHDPWSLFMRGVVARVRQRRGFEGQLVTELGIGDGRNIREAGRGVKEVLGVDIEEWRLKAAGVNLVTGPARLEIPVELWRAEAVEFLRNFGTIGRHRLSGWAFMCLPQSPSGLNFADRYDGSLTLNSYHADWDRSGLTLNAGALDNLRKVAGDLRTLIILSDRVPADIRIRLINQTGWQIERQVQTSEPIQQDPDTGIGWVSQIDDGGRFYELVAPKQYSSISATEAEKRRLESLVSGLGRDRLNVFHHLTVYQLRPH